MLLLAVPSAAAAQGTAIEQDSARTQIHAVLRAFYLSLANQNWDALAAYVLSPKLLERRGGPGGPQNGRQGPYPRPRHAARAGGPTHVPIERLADDH